MPDGIDATAAEASGRILIVDDESAIIDSLRLLLESAGYAVLSAATASQGLEAVARDSCDLVLLDLMLPDRPGLDVLAEIRAIDPDLPVVMLTAFGSIETAVEATRRGAANFLTKPWNNTKLLLEIGQVLERRRLLDENERLRVQLGRSSAKEKLIGTSDAIRHVFEMIEQVAPTSSTVLVSGESGTGKELVARAIHKRSPRAGKPFVTVNAGTIPADMLESTLFGHVKGAFTGATRDRQGCFAVAHEGTLFLDEVSTLSAEAQAKLLSVIQEREFVPVGSNDPSRVDVRIVAATNDDLAAAAEAGRFRADLYYRLNVIGIEVPPLRERAADIPLLIDEFLAQFCRRERHHFLDRDRRSTLRFTPEALRILKAHAWPGNVRELRNAIERTVVLATQEELGPELLPASVLSGNREASLADPSSFHRRAGATLAEMVEGFERRVVLDELEKHRFNQTEAAKSLRVALSTLNQKIQRWGIDVKRRRAESDHD